jgi:hypothetical protein
MSVAGKTDNQVAHTSNSPFSIVLRPNIACGSTSYAIGPSLTLITAGFQGSFLIFARDSYFNDRSSESDDSFVVRVRQFTGSSFNNFECAGSNLCQSWNTYNTNAVTIGGRDKVGTIKRLSTGYVASFHATRSGINYVWATLGVAGGLQATYYGGDASFASPPDRRFVKTDQTVDFCASGAFLGGIQNFGVFSARWTGSISPPATGQYTLSMDGTSLSQSKAERVKLWVSLLSELEV